MPLPNGVVVSLSFVLRDENCYSFLSLRYNGDLKMSINDGCVSKFAWQLLWCSSIINEL